MAGTCPHCNTKISGQLRTCPSCGGYYLLSQEKCPECGIQFASLAAPPSEGSQEEKVDLKEAPLDKRSPDGERKKGTRKKRRRISPWGCLAGILFCLILCGAGGYYYYLQWQQQKEQADYERLQGITNPDFYQQFLDAYPESQYRDEIQARMLGLQEEAKDWELLLIAINRKSVSGFLKKYPNSLRLRLCEDMLDSIDWQDALARNSEMAVTEYLAKHPSGRYVTEAAEKKNALLLAKATPEERAMIRGVLETFFSKAIANQDIEVAREAISDTTMNFCGNPNADAEAIVQYARDKMEKDVIGLHYLISQQMEIHKETLPDGNIGFSIEVNLQETISRTDMNQPASNLYRVSALLNQEQKIVRMNITK